MRGRVVGVSVAVEVEELAKRYEPAGVQALDGVTFSVSGGEIFGLLGRNGAGKSTTVRILTTLLRPSGGTARVGGHDVVADPVPVRAMIGVALQEASLDDLMTGREHLVLGARLGGAGAAAARTRAQELLEALGLAGAADRMAAGYSGGMRRRLDVAMAMLRRPQVLFLDEPTTGLDPQGRRALWGIIRSLRAQGSTVVLTTQQLEEADELADRVAVVHDGRISAIGSPAQLKAELGGPAVLRLLLPSGDRHLAIHSSGVQRATEAADGWIELTVADDAEAAARLQELTRAGATLEGLELRTPTLEDVFVNLTGTEIETSARAVAPESLSAVRRGTGLATKGRS